MKETENRLKYLEWRVESDTKMLESIKDYIDKNKEEIKKLKDA